MDEKEIRLNELKQILKPFNILSYIALGVAAVGVVFIILGIIIRNDPVIDKLFAIGIGLFAACIIFTLSIVIIERKQYDEYNRLKKEIKQK